MSPILFLFFSAPTLEKASKYRYKGSTIYVFAYIDDTYILLVSRSYETNCRAIERCHGVIMKCATTLGVTFSPLYSKIIYALTNKFRHSPRYDI